jgi:hypothetical protein
MTVSAVGALSRRSLIRCSMPGRSDTSLSLDSVAVQFDGTRLISDAGLLLCATLADRLSIKKWSTTASGSVIVTACCFGVPRRVREMAAELRASTVRMRAAATRSQRDRARARAFAARGNRVDARGLESERPFHSRRRCFGQPHRRNQDRWPRIRHHPPRAWSELAVGVLTRGREARARILPIVAP